MRSRTIYFATTNDKKIEEAKRILNTEVLGTGLEIDEVQSLDKVYVAKKKAEAYHKELKSETLVEDVSLEFDAIGPLPGTYINDFWKTLGADGMCSLIPEGASRAATAYTTLVFIDQKGKYHEFIGEMKGEIARSPRGENGFGWDPIFIPDGYDKTLAELTDEEKDNVSMRAKAFKKLAEYLDNDINP